MLNQLSRVEFARLIAEGSHDEVCARARRVINRTNLINRHESMDLHDALKEVVHRRLFAEALYALLYGEEDRETEAAGFELNYRIELNRLTYQHLGDVGRRIRDELTCGYHQHRFNAKLMHERR